MATKEELEKQAQNNQKELSELRDVVGKLYSELNSMISLVGNMNQDVMAAKAEIKQLKLVINKIVDSGRASVGRYE